MKKEKFEKINEKKLDDISGGTVPLLPQDTAALHISAYAGPKPIHPRPWIDLVRPVIRPAVPTIDEKIARLKELREKLKEANGNPSTELLKEMLDLMKDIDDIKKKLADIWSKDLIEATVTE